MAMKSENASQPYLNAIFDVLTHEHRRYLLSFLQETPDGIATLDDLVDQILAQDASVEDRDTIATHLHHTHLPKLADAEIIEYDTHSQTVQYRDDPLLDEWVNRATVPDIE